MSVIARLRQLLLGRREVFLWRELGLESRCGKEVRTMSYSLRQLWQHDEGQDIAEYAVMLAVILVLVVGTIRLIGTSASNAFSSAASSIQ